MIRRSLVGAIALALVAASAPALAAPPAAVSNPSEAQSRRSFQSAEAHFQAGRFAEALSEYQAGYQLAPLPGFLINIAQCYRRLGDLTRARATYRKFIMVAPDSPFVPQVKTLIAELDQLANDLDGERKPAPGLGTAAASETLPLDATDPETTAAASGTALVAVPAAPAASSNNSAAKRWWLWGAIGAAIAATATTAFFVLRTPDANTVHDGTLGTLRR